MYSDTTAHCSIHNSNTPLNLPRLLLPTVERALLPTTVAVAVVPAQVRYMPLALQLLVAAARAVVITNIICCSDCSGTSMKQQTSLRLQTA
jgi:hypothetical protein